MVTVTRAGITLHGTEVVARPEVVRAEDLVKVYGRSENQVEALRGANLNVMAGEWVSVIGPSGSGKSTLMNLLGLLDRPNSGCYVLDGRDVSSLNSGQLAEVRRAKIGFVFQSYNLLARLSALENVELPMVYAGVGRRKRKRRATELLRRVGLSGRENHKPPELSGGQRQRTAIARALVNRPAILLADEPTGNLDVASEAAILELFCDITAWGVTLIMVTHDMDVAACADRIVEVRDGFTVSGEPSRAGTLQRRWAWR